MAKGQDKPPKHTRMTDAQLRGLHEAGASGTEVLTYALLTRFHNDEAHPSRAFVSAQYASEATGIDQTCVSRALRGLCRKRFTSDAAGRPVNVLSKVSRGHNGRAATYDDNLYRCAVLERSYPNGNQNPADSRLEGRQGCNPTDEVAGQDCNPTDEVAGQGCNPTDEVAGQGCNPTDEVAGQGCNPTDEVAGQGCNPSGGSSRAITTSYAAGSSKADRHPLQGSVAAPHKDTLLATPPNKHGKGTEGRGCMVDPLVSAAMVRGVAEAPGDSYGYTDEDQEAHFQVLADYADAMGASA